MPNSAPRRSAHRTLLLLRQEIRDHLASIPSAHGLQFLDLHTRLQQARAELEREEAAWFAGRAILAAGRAA